jgi:ATP-dependent Clp protease protease subunit
MSKHGLLIEGVELSGARRVNLRMPDRNFAVNVKDGDGGKKVAEMLLYDVIGQDWLGEGLTAKRVEDELRNIGDDVDELHVLINSPGGVIYEALGIYNALVRHPAKVVTQNIGAAWSAAGWILQAGDERLMSENATLMIHNSQGMAFGDRHAMLKESEVLDQMDETIAITFAKRSGRKTDTFRKLMDKESWFSAEKSLAEKLVDGVVSAKSSATNLDPRAFGYNMRLTNDVEPEQEAETVEGNDDDTEVDAEPAGVTEVDVKLRLIELEG